MIKKVKISNFRSVKDITVNFLPYMVFVGKNNSGKSNIMKALDIFFTDSVGINDFRKENGRLNKPYISPNWEILLPFWYFIILFL